MFSISTFKCAIPVKAGYCQYLLHNFIRSSYSVIHFERITKRLVLQKGTP